MHELVGRKISVMRDAEVIFKKQVPFSILLLGVADREGDGGRSDTIVVMTVNPTVQSTKNGQHSKRYIYRNNWTKR